jgi:uncharacterized membrane protein (UPF0127 family)
MQIRIERNGFMLAERAEVAEGVVARLIGLIGKGEMSSGSALVLPGCRQIHTFFMRFAIDLVCVDADWRVLCTRRCIAPWRFGPMVSDAAYAIELPSGTVTKSAIEVGDVLVAETDS